VFYLPSFWKAENAQMPKHSRIYFIVLGFLFLIAAWFGIVTGDRLFFIAPFLLLAFIWVCLNPSALLYILLGSIPWSIEYNFTQSLGSDLPDEPLMLLTSFAILAFILYQRKRNIPINFSTLLFLLLLQLTWIVVSVALSTNALVSAKYLLAKTWYIGAFVVAPFIVFQDRKKFLRAVIILTASMMAFTILTMVRHTAAGLDFGSINPSLKPFFRNHVNYSALLVCMIPILFAFYRHANKTGLKRLLAFLIFITIVATYFSYARGAWLALITGGISYWLIRNKFLVRGYVLAFIVVFAGLIWLIRDNKYLDYAHDYNTTIFHEDFKEHLVATYKMKDVSTAERFYRWIAGVRMVKHEWQTGFGPNTFNTHYKEYAVPAFKTWVSKNEDRSTVHNYFLLTIVEQGIPGLIILLVLIGYMFYTAQKIYLRSEDRFTKTTAATVASILVMLCTVNFLSDLVETDKLGSIFYLCLAVLLVLEKQSQRSNRSMGQTN
jgi:O-antigen ligase